MFERLADLINAPPVANGHKVNAWPVANRLKVNARPVANRHKAVKDTALHAGLVPLRLVADCSMSDANQAGFAFQTKSLVRA